MIIKEVIETLECNCAAPKNQSLSDLRICNWSPICKLYLEIEAAGISITLLAESFGRLRQKGRMFLIILMMNSWRSRNTTSIVKRIQNVCTPLQGRIQRTSSGSRFLRPINPRSRVHPVWASVTRCAKHSPVTRWKSFSFKWRKSDVVIVVLFVHSSFNYDHSQYAGNNKQYKKDDPVER